MKIQQCFVFSVFFGPKDSMHQTHGFHAPKNDDRKTGGALEEDIANGKLLLTTVAEQVGRSTWDDLVVNFT